MNRIELLVSYICLSISKKEKREKRKKWYSWHEIVSLALSMGYEQYGWHGSHLVMKKGDYYVHIPYKNKTRKHNYKKIQKKLERRKCLTQIE